MNDDHKYTKKEYLLYLVDNCIEDFEALIRTNNELLNGMKQTSSADVNYLGLLNRCIQSNLTIKVASLFDRDNRSISLYNGFDHIFDKFKKEVIIDKIIDARNKFIAHNDFRYLENGDFGLSTHRISTSNLRGLLSDIKKTINKEIIPAEN